MLLPIEFFHMCVRIHIDISDIRRDRERGRDVPDARSCSGNKAFPASPAARPPACPCGRVRLWVLGPARSRGPLRPTSLAAGGYTRVSYLRPPYSYAIVTGFISPFVGPAYSYLHTSLLTYPWVAVTVADRLGISEWRPRPPFGGRAADASVSARSDLRRYEHRLRCDGRVALAPRD